MIEIPSTIENLQIQYGLLKNLLEKNNFHLGGGYNYDHGYMDKPLDWESTEGYRYYLRIPLFTISGNLEANNAVVKLGKPFVIKHEFLTTNDHTGDINLVSSLVNQFSEPIATTDEPINPKWIQRAKKTIYLIESILA